MTFKAKHFLWQEQDRVGIITLNRPERKNPLTFESYAELRDTFHALKRKADIRAIVIHGAGDNFCSGGDVHEIIGPLVAMEMPELLQFTRMTGELIAAMREAPQPILSAIDGVCAGAGAAIAMASDFRFGTSRSKVAFLFSKVGLAGCDMGACAMLPRLIGQGRAAELLFTGREMEAQEALDWGFYQKLISANDELLKVAVEFASNLAQGPTFAHSMTKKMLDQLWGVSINQALEAEAQAQAICMATEDFKRAYQAFAAKQKPVFQGN